jgi:RNA polymerase sigma-70 factor (ECF subfamily)
VDQRTLVERAQRGDHDAFATLARAAVARQGAAARLILRDTELARDAVQEALIGAWRDLPSLRDPDRFDAWLSRLTVHACLALARRRRRRPVEIDIQPVEVRASDDFASDIADRDQLERALRELDPERRALVVMHLYLGLPLPEVAAQLGIPLGTAKSRLNRSLTTLRLALDPASDASDTTRAIPEGGQPA